MGKRIAYDYDRRTAADEDPPKKVITIEFTDRYGDTAPAILKALHFLKWCGDVGSSRSLRTDLNDKDFLQFDGDGDAGIDSIKLDGEEVKASKEDIDEFNEVTR